MIIKEFLECVNCSKKEWVLKNKMKELVKQNQMPDKVHAWLHRTIVDFKDPTKQYKIGDTYQQMLFARDVCENCGHDQIICIEEVTITLVRDVSNLIKPKPTDLFRV